MSSPLSSASASSSAKLDHDHDQCASLAAVDGHDACTEYGVSSHPVVPYPAVSYAFSHCIEPYSPIVSSACPYYYGSNDYGTPYQPYHTSVYMSTASSSPAFEVASNDTTPPTSALLQQHEQQQQHTVSRGHKSSTQVSRSAIKLQHKISNDNTLQWLSEHYESQPGVCMPRCMLYENYMNYMVTGQPNHKAIGAAAFGKLVRQMFPNITTRRLGTRGQSKYHYYGISIKPSSPYFRQTLKGGRFAMRRDMPPGGSKSRNQPNDWSDESEEMDEACSLDQARIDADDTNRVESEGAVLNRPMSCSSNGTDDYGQIHQSLYAYQPKAVVTSVITSSAQIDGKNESSGVIAYQPRVSSADVSCSAQFSAKYPQPQDFNTVRPYEVQPWLVQTFLIMYQQHSQRLLDTFQLANTMELERAITHFWREMPAHMSPLIASPFLADLVECIDSLLYQSLETMLRSISLKPDMSTTFMCDMDVILTRMDIWMNTAFLSKPSRMIEIIFKHHTQKIHGRVLSPAAMTNSQVNTVNILTNKQIDTLLSRKRKVFTQFAEVVRHWLSFHQFAKRCRNLPETSRMQDQLRRIGGFEIISSLSYTFESGEEQAEWSSFLSLPNRTNLVLKIKQTLEQMLKLLLNEHNNHENSALACELAEMPLDAILALLSDLVHTCLAFEKSEISKFERVAMSRLLFNRFNFFNGQIMQHLVDQKASTKEQWNNVFTCLRAFFELEIFRLFRIEEQDNRQAMLMGKMTAEFQDQNQIYPFLGSQVSYLDEIYQPFGGYPSYDNSEDKDSQAKNKTVPEYYAPAIANSTAEGFESENVMGPSYNGHSVVYSPTQYAMLYHDQPDQGQQGYQEQQPPQQYYEPVYLQTQWPQVAEETSYYNPLINDDSVKAISDFSSSSSSSPPIGHESHLVLGAAGSSPVTYESSVSPSLAQTSTSTSLSNAYSCLS